jgi:hypothetical protein
MLDAVQKLLDICVFLFVKCKILLILNINLDLI